MAELNFVEVTWQRALKVWWSLIWRGLLFTFLATGAVGLAIGFIMELIKLNPEVIRTVCIIAGYVVCIPVGIIVTKSILNKHYSDFKIVLINK